MDADKAENAYLAKLEYRNLWKFGVSERNAGIVPNTRKGYRRSADSPIVKQIISSKKLKKAGYTFFLDACLETAAQT